MSEIARVNRDHAKNSPEETFEQPSDITQQEGLTRAEKLSALRSWAFNVRRRLDSANEGMAPEPDPDAHAGAVTQDAELLRDIELEIDSLTSEKAVVGK